MADQVWAAPLGRIPSGLFIVTARKGDAETGMLASWVQQCSFTPPCLSVALAPGRLLGDWLTEGASFVVNIVAEDAKPLLVHFGKGFPPGADAFAGQNVERDTASAPVLMRALAHLDCRVRTRVPAGDHDLLVAEIVGGRLHGEGKAAVHHRKSGLSY